MLIAVLDFKTSTLSSLSFLASSSNVSKSDAKEGLKSTDEDVDSKVNESESKATAARKEMAPPKSFPPPFLQVVTNTVLRSYFQS